MALIKCPECGKEVSDKAPRCIHCGYSFIGVLKTQTQETLNISKETRLGQHRLNNINWLPIVLGSLGLILIVLIGAFGLVYFQSKSKEGKQKEGQQQKVEENKQSTPDSQQRTEADSQNKPMIKTNGQGFIGSIYDKNSYGVLCYTDLINNKYQYQICFEGIKPCLLSESRQVIKYLNEPYEGQKVVFLTNNNKVGIGNIDSIGGGMGEYSGLLFCSVKEGTKGNIIMSENLYNAFNRGNTITPRATLEDSVIKNIVLKKVKSRGISFSALRPFKVASKIPALYCSSSVMWLVRLEGEIKVNKQDFMDMLAQDTFLDTSTSYHESLYQTAQAEVHKYVINAVLVPDRSGFKVEFYTADPAVHGDDPLCGYCKSKGLFYIDFNGSLEQESRDHNSKIVDYVDINYDGVPELVIEYWGYEGDGSFLMKGDKEKWKMVGDYYNGV